jgi:hypothetical protein
MALNFVLIIGSIMFGLMGVVAFLTAPSADLPRDERLYQMVLLLYRLMCIEAIALGVILLAVALYILYFQDFVERVEKIVARLELIRISLHDDEEAAELMEGKDASDASTGDSRE